MANLSDKTRKQQVLGFLWDHSNQWVDGPLLATEEIGGSEGLRRLRELRLEGEYDIRERRHPDAQRDIWQYMLVVSAVATPSAGTVEFSAPPPKGAILDLAAELDFGDAKPNYPDPATENARREEEAQRLLDLPVDEPESPWPSDHGQTRMSSAVKKKEDGTFEYVPPQRPLVEQLTTPADPPQPPTFKFDRMPSKISYGEVAICPRCHSKTTRGRKTKVKEDDGQDHIRQRKSKTKAGPALVDDDGILLFRDPHGGSKPRPCDGCNGYGIVPNRGPVPFTPPTGLVQSEGGEEAESLEAFPE